MRTWQVIIIGICLMFMLAACSQSNSSNWYDTKDEAIKFGLQKEGTDKSAILSIEEYKGETMVFYEHANALGVASITENKEGYSWFRNVPYLGFDVSGDLSYTTAGVTYETEKGLEVPILYGKLLDTSIQKVNLTGDGNERELRIFENSPFFFTIHEESYQSLEVIPEIL